MTTIQELVSTIIIEKKTSTIKAMEYCIYSEPKQFKEVR